MKIEYEATYLNINKEEVRMRLKKAGAVLVKSEFLQKRVALDLPLEKRADNKWLRVRDEGDQITLSLKEIDGNKIENQKEICLEVNNFEDAVELLKSIGCIFKSYQETKRELWRLDDVDITIDEWPFLEPFIEVEGFSEEKVKITSEKIGFNYSKALFCAVGELYKLKYDISHEEINKIPKIVFDMHNPFLK
jgi:adenylate cyclase, class 2